MGGAAAVAWVVGWLTGQRSWRRVRPRGGAIAPLDLIGIAEWSMTDKPWIGERIETVEER